MKVFLRYRDEIEILAEKLGVEIRIPRRAGKQIHRDNTEGDTPEIYFRRTIHIPLLDNVIEDLKCRFSDEVLQLFNFSFLFSSAMSELEEQDLKTSNICNCKKVCNFLQ